MFFFLLKMKRNKSLIHFILRKEEKATWSKQLSILLEKISRLNWLTVFFSYRKYSKLFKTQLSKLFQKKGLPAIVHVHIAFKAGLMAQWIKKKFGIPYLLTEQWTIYLDEARPGIDQFSRIDRFLIGKIITGASLLLPVSQYLGNAIRKRWSTIEVEVVPNVVNTSLFKPVNYIPSNLLKLVHISTLNYQKDPESLLQAALLLKKKSVPFSLDIFGPRKEAIVSFIHNNELGKHVILHGEVPQSKLAECIQQCDALVLYSRYETFGCVLIEANACGKPAIVPDTPLMRELFQDSHNGILVKPGSAEELANAMINFYRTRDEFNPTQIATTTLDKYSYTRVGKMYVDIYSRYSKSTLR